MALVRKSEYSMKKLLFVFLLLSFTSLYVLYYYWQQATQIPTWYTLQSKNTQKNIDFSKFSELIADQAILEAKIEASIAKSEAIARSKKSFPLAKRNEVQSRATQKAIAPESPESSTSANRRTSSQDNSLRQTSLNSTKHETSNNKNVEVEVELSNQEVNELMMKTIAEHTSYNPALTRVPSLHTTIKDGVIESGTVVNLANISSNQLAEKETEALEKMIKSFPFLENKQIYVGISGNPQIENGQLKWDNNTQIKLGNLSLSLLELSRRLEIPKEKLEQKLNLSLPLGRLKVKDMELIDDKVLLRGSVEKGNG